jgi:protein gp37
MTARLALQSMQAPGYLSWADATFNPWLQEELQVGSQLLDQTLQTCPRVVSGHAQALLWEAQAQAFASEHAGRRRRVFAGPWCSVLGGPSNDDARSAFWELVRRTPNIDWLVLADDGYADSSRLPSDWMKGYRNVWVGATLSSIGTVGAVLDCLRQVPATLRFVMMQPNPQDLGDLDLRGVGWVVIRCHDEMDPSASESVHSVRLQAMYQGVPVWVDKCDSVPHAMLAGFGQLDVKESPRLGQK